MPFLRPERPDKGEKTTRLHAAQQFPFKTIVAAIDFTDESSAALRCAQELARLRHAMLLLVHVIDPVGYAFPAGAPVEVGRDKAAREELGRIVGELRKRGFRCILAWRQGLFASGYCCRCGITKRRCWCWARSHYRRGARGAGSGDAAAAGALAVRDSDGGS
jgi:hypothetical protein